MNDYSSTCNSRMHMQSDISLPKAVREAPRFGDVNIVFTTYSTVLSDYKAGMCRSCSYRIFVGVHVCVRVWYVCRLRNRSPLCSTRKNQVKRRTACSTNTTGQCSHQRRLQTTRANKHHQNDLTHTPTTNRIRFVHSSARANEGGALCSTRRTSFARATRCRHALCLNSLYDAMRYGILRLRRRWRF